jgi:hypothetical protein
MTTIEIHNFIEWCRNLSGTEITTRSGRSKFIMNVLQNGLEFKPLSSMKPRICTERYVKLILHHFAKTKSFKTSDYRNITANSSYMLTLIDLYMKIKAND